MSELSYLEKLLDGAEVEWVALNKLATFLKGKSLPKEKITPDGNRYCIHYGELFTHYGPIIDKVCSKTNQAINESILSEKNDVLMPTSDVTPRGLATASCIQESGVILGGDILIIRCSGVDGRYLSNFIINNKKKILQMVKGSTVYHLYAKDIGKLLIPIPCPNNPEKSLAIQSEIVRILDKFTALTAELTAELNMRKKQYNYYRDQLLSFDESSVEWKTLLEACDYVDYRGKTPKKTQSGIFLVTAKNIRMGYIDYHASQEFISEEDYAIVMRRGLPKKGDVLITTEAPCGFVAQVNRENIALAQRVIKYRSKNTQLSNSFLKHYLLGSQFQDKLMQAATGSTVKGIKGSRLHQLKIPIPSKVEQDRIVAILDKFDTLTNSITEGLPREIELRQKQYEYYRDLLFSFPKPETVSN
ncbi:restriction endonuclease subunit S [Escherichia coli]|uniref:restriction endonuclease subunit S n=1 Tax=Escherichia coli TaxID=562 RepID=UPI00132FB347|nr:restriction endonuclease subunit S [Escherichia coli]MCK2746283.1 restriction endonuclease subunit S [Escherichia coli]